MKSFFLGIALALAVAAWCFALFLPHLRGMLAPSSPSAPAHSMSGMTMAEHMAMMGMAPSAGSGTYDFDRANLPAAVPTPVVDLADGDRYTLSVSAVRKTIDGKPFTMLAYNGSIPGPVLRVGRGSTVHLTLRDELPDLPTTLHSHGVRLDERYDGVPVEQGGKTPAATPGRDVSYTVKFPDFGAFWYHPHIRDDVGQGLGLYGTYLVTDTASGYVNPVDREEVVVLSDLLTETGKAAAFLKEKTDRALMGRYGNVLLANGDTRYAATARVGDVVRFYFINAASARPFRISIDGARMKLVGADMGRYPRETWVDSVTIGPAERSVVEVAFAKAGTYRILHSTPDKTVELGSVTVPDGIVDRYADYVPEFEKLHERPDELAEAKGFEKYLAKAPDESLSFSIAMKGMEGMGNMDHSGMAGAVGADGIEWEDDMGAMNAMSASDTIEWRVTDDATKKSNGDIRWEFARGSLVKIRLYNDPKSMHPMQHPFHLHGQRFVILSTDGVPETNPAWKDTVMVPVGRTVDILADMSNPGDWMAHCHIAEHLHSGMMFGFSIK